MKAQLHQTREAWLHYIAQRMAPMFEQLGAPLPAQLRIAIGFTSSGRRSRNIGECWDNQCSEDGHFEIFIRPDLSESQDPMPMQVAAILGHELVHAAVGVAARHGKEFRRVAKGIGLVGQMKATTAGPAFEQALRPILAAAGQLPHGRLRLAVGASSHSSRGQKPYSRPIKCCL
jgi:SprT-like family